MTREIKNIVRITRSDPDAITVIDPHVKPARKYTQREWIARAQEDHGYWHGRTDILVVNYADGGQECLWATEEGFSGIDFRELDAGTQEWCREERERLLKFKDDPQMKLYLLAM